MATGVKVFNGRTKESVMSNENGRYTIPVKKDDILIFSKEGLQDFGLKVTDKITQNALMKRD
ncbi:hypothetical protein [uncultured Croceitalea sp.]|uniref:hypothetical protein n=1 Tax=uncultured Croceitalea sp. TaxID=1798908 RepID=UPI00330560A7